MNSKSPASKQIALTLFLLSPVFLLSLLPSLGFALTYTWQVLEGALWVREKQHPIWLRFSLGHPEPLNPVYTLELWIASTLKTLPKTLLWGGGDLQRET